MLQLLHGPDSFSRAEALTSLRRSLDSDGMLASNTERLDGRSLAFAHLQMICDAAPFLAAHRLVIVEGLLVRLAGRSTGRRRGAAAAKSPEEWQALPEYAAHMPPTTTLVLVDSELPERNPLVASLVEHGRTRAFPRLPLPKIQEWIAARAKARGVTIEPGAARLLAESAGQELSDDGQWHALWSVDGDLEKLALYAGARPVTVEDVRALVSGAADTNIFAFVDAVLERRGEEALRRLSDLLFAGQPPPVVLTMLVRGYRQLVLYTGLAGSGARPEEIGRRLNIHPYALNRVHEQAARYTAPRLAAIYERLLAADRGIKRGEIDETTALETLTAELAAVG